MCVLTTRIVVDRGPATGKSPAVQELATRLRARARELGLADAAVARLLGLSPSRYANYVQGTREPDYATLLRICAALRTTPDWLLGYDTPGADRGPDAAARKRVALAARALSGSDLAAAVTVLEALAQVAGTRDATPPEPQIPDRAGC
jgi:transcriptional regulator with XRE-family HTH domain